MKCPKCGYLGFDRVDRCRNCGYEFALARDVFVPELPLRAEPPQTDGFADLSLVAPRAEEPTTPDLRADLDRVFSASSVTEAVVSRPAAVPLDPSGTRFSQPAAFAPPVAPEAPDDALPLFGGPITDDVPLITKPSPPRPPLAVRRSTPEVPRLRAESPRASAGDLRLDLEVPEAPVSSVEPSARARASRWPDQPSETTDDAALLARLVAVAIDLVVLALIDVAVVYFTMQICGLTIADLDILPRVPLLAFLAVQNGGYLIAFTAGGQTLGKMITGIRVVTAGTGSSLDVGRAAIRTLMWIVLAIPAGLGFLSAVFSADHRGLHDRCAGSRVVRASA